jgi:phage/plasmid primase-like uncharacterized protein
MGAFSDIAAAANDHALELAPWVLGQRGQRCGRTLRFENKGRISVFVLGPKRGKWIDFSSGDKGDMIDLIARSRGIDSRAALDEARRWLGLPEGARPVVIDQTARAIEDADDLARRRAKALQIWQCATEPAAATSAYLRTRGISLAPGGWLRQGRISPKALAFLGPKAEALGTLDTLVFAASDPDGRLRAVQQILVRDGRKAPLETAKLTRGDVRGAAVRMGRGETVVLCEGPETGLSLRECTGLPVAVALGAGLLFQAEFGPEVRRVVVAADLGGPGLDAAKRAAAVLCARGIDVRLALPPEAAGEKADFNDVHVRLGANAVRAAVLGA